MAQGFALFPKPMPDDTEPTTTETNAEKLPPLNIVMQINRTQRAAMPLHPRILIGRGEDGTMPMFDLTRYGALEQGVSRLHAALTYQDQALHIEDLGSTNGTRINGLQIPPNTPYRLRSGDEIELGKLSISLRLVRAP